MKKKTYESPELNLIILLETDIITASGGNNVKEDDGENDGEWI